MTAIDVYFKLIDTVPLSAFFIDKEGEIAHVNPRCLKMLNVSLHEVTNKSITHFYPEFDSCIQNEGENIQTAFIDQDLNKSKVLVNYSSIENTAFGILYVISEPDIHPDIYEKQLFSNIILDNIPADIAVFDKDHNYLYINPNGIRDVKTREWLIGKSDFDYCNYKGIDKTLAQNRREIFAKSIQTKQQIEWLDEYERGGKNVYVLRRFYPVFAGKTFLYMIGYGVDISELKKTQKKVASNEMRNQLILNSALDAVIIVCPQGLITFWNQQAEILFGWKSEEVLGKAVSDIVIPERFREKHLRGMKNHNEGLVGGAVNGIVEFPALNKTKGEFPVECSILPIYDKGVIINYCSFLRDISARKNKEFEINQKNKILENQNSELEQFTYITSHDLQEPIVTLMSFSDLLLEEFSGSLDSEAKLYIEYINKSAIRMRALVTGLMEYARIGIRDDAEEIDCNQILKDVLDDLSAQIKITEAKIVIEDLPVIRGYETYIRLLFQNLISNAIKFKRENGIHEVKITFSETEKEWMFSVKDNGIGIEEKDLDQVFVIFKRLNNESLYRGYGIGLAHCRKIVKMHHGEIHVKSTFGQGSKFTFTILKSI
ncbi:MAG: PAS domain S-box protein [Proteobacteria bacterium]|nr:PAS domain S-box protein [Pseudomonadota bacterium]